MMNIVGPPNNITIVEKSWTRGKATIYLLPQNAISFHTNKYDPSDSTRISSIEKIGQSGALILCRKRLTSCHRIEALYTKNRTVQMRCLPQHSRQHFPGRIDLGQTIADWVIGCSTRHSSFSRQHSHWAACHRFCSA